MVELMTIYMTDTQYLQQNGTLAGKITLADKSNNTDAFSKTLQQAQAKVATKTVSAAAPTLLMSF